MKADAARRNLDGSVAGVVGAAHAGQAAARMAGAKLRLKRREAQRTQPVNPAPEPAPMPTEPKRISLADLRAAAQARRQAQAA
jgi:sRNA-binding protein